MTGREPKGPAVKAALARLSRSNKIASLVKRPATWLVVAPEQAAYGAPPVAWWIDDFIRQDEPGYYVALLSAARYWGSAHYALQTTPVKSRKFLNDMDGYLPPGVPYDPVTAYDEFRQVFMPHL